jgi:hypothetical protein
MILGLFSRTGEGGSQMGAPFRCQNSSGLFSVCLTGSGGGVDVCTVDDARAAHDGDGSHEAGGSGSGDNGNGSEHGRRPDGVGRRPVGRPERHRPAGVGSSGSNRRPR